MLQDPSFEAYTPNPYWDEASTNFGTPLCTIADCGDGGGTASPRTGSVWAWFGGIAADETASVAQDILIPTGANDLSFNFWIGNADTGSDAGDVFTAKIDGVTLFTANATQIASYPVYTLIDLDISAYADDAVHTLLFSSVTTVQNVNFNLDDVAIDAPIAGDAYEDDDLYPDASTIVNGVPQDHCIDPVGDLDWVTFTLGSPSAVTIETSGANPTSDDTYMELYEGLVPEYLANNDDIDYPNNLYSRIAYDCSDPLPAGTYYAVVAESSNTETIAAYQLTYMFTPCASGDEFAYLPIDRAPGESPGSLRQVQPGQRHHGRLDDADPGLGGCDRRRQL